MDNIVAIILEGMKKVLKEKLLPLIFVVTVLLIALAFYLQGKISIFPQKLKTDIIKDKKTEIIYSEKEYKLSYNEKYQNGYFDISHFEEKENWQGDGQTDYVDRFEGNTSLLLNSQNNNKVSASLEIGKNLTLDDNFFVSMYINLRTPPETIEDLNIIFIDSKSGERYRYAIRQINQGWNFPRMQFGQFSAVGSNTQTRPRRNQYSFDKVVFELTSRKGSLASVNLDHLWVERNNDYLKDWNVKDSNFFSLGESIGNVALMAKSYFASMAALKRIGTAKNYNFQAKFIPKEKGAFGLFVNGDYNNGFGYYLVLDGIGSGHWRMFKNGDFGAGTHQILLNQGNISNFQVEEDKAYYLKTEAREFKVFFLIALDGKTFVQLGEVPNDSYPSGGIGIAALDGAFFLVDDLYFNQ